MKKRLLAVMLGLVLAFSACSSVFATVWEGNPIDTLYQLTDGKMQNKEAAVEAVANHYAEEVAAGKYKLVDTATLKAWYDANKKMVVVDTMPAKWYDGRHLPNAINAVMALNPNTEFTKAQIKANEKALLKAVTAATKKINKKNYKKVTVVVYCGFVKCGRSHNGAAYLVKKGFKNVYRYGAGCSGWADMGYPMFDKDGNAAK